MRFDPLNQVPRAEQNTAGRTAEEVVASQQDKIGAGTQSGPVVIKDSTGPLSGLGCDDTEQLCRWGDYAAATPDPCICRTWSRIRAIRGEITTVNAPSTRAGN